MPYLLDVYYISLVGTSCAKNGCPSKNWLNIASNSSWHGIASGRPIMSTCLQHLWLQSDLRNYAYNYLPATVMSFLLVGHLEAWLETSKEDILATWRIILMPFIHQPSLPSLLLSYSSILHLLPQPLHLAPFWGRRPIIWWWERDSQAARQIGAVRTYH